MSEFHYYSPVPGDNHLAVWWYVRAYFGGRVEIETVVENGWLNVASPGQKDYTASVAVGGSTRYTGAVNHYHHSRWSRVDWVGTDYSGITPTHDMMYLKATRLIPNYGNFGTASSAAFAYTETATPMNRGNYRPDFDATGDSDTDQIGLLPPWEALYVTTGDARAYRYTIANARMAGSLSAHYRDENTGKPLKFSDNATKTLDVQGSLPANSGGQAATLEGASKAAAHAPSMGYFAYLLTGRRTFMEEAQFWATKHYLDLWDYRSGSAGLFAGNQPRAMVWGLRQLAQSACVTPDGETEEFSTSFDANVAWMYTNAVAPGSRFYTSLGLVTPARLDSDGAKGNGYFDTALWQYDWMTCVLAWAQDMEVSKNANLNDVLLHSCKTIVGRLGTSSDYCYRRVCAYVIPVAKPEDYLTGGSMYLSSWAEVYSTFKNLYGFTDGAGFTDGGQTLVEGTTPIESSRWRYSYAGHALAAACYAKDKGATGASAAYALLAGSSSFQSQKSAFADSPKWGIEPR